MKKKTQRLYVLLCSAAMGSQLLAPGYAAMVDRSSTGQQRTYSKTLQITATEAGGFSISALVKPTRKAKPVPMQDATNAQQPGQLLNRIAEPAAAQPLTKDQVDQMIKQATDKITQQQQQLLNKITQQQQALSAQTNAAIQNLANQQIRQTQVLRNQLAQMTAAQRQQAIRTNALLQQVAAQQQMPLNNAAIQAQLMQQQQMFLANAFAQWQQDQMLRNFENNFLADPRFLATPGTGWSARDILGAVRDMFNSARMNAMGFGGGQRMPSLDEVANRVQQQLADRLPEEIAKRVSQAMADSMQQQTVEAANADKMAALTDKLAQIVDRLPASPGAQNAYAIDPFTFKANDYERLATLAAQMPDAQTKRLFLELALEAAGRAATNQAAPQPQRQKARDFVLALAPKFQELKTTLAVDATDDTKAALDFDINKCLMVSSGKGLYL